MRGKGVEVSKNGLVTFHDAVIVKEENLNKNFHCLRTMAQSIVDDALGRLAVDGSWHTAPMSRLQLGTMLVDMTRV